ncbi:hypothetical protein [Tessaracoccus lacteus]|uniref:Uncharacterized protein n=1 Tax=Tessaracoccus lacteus TaxID=3041766 RepID=A0ABY8Q1B4_9ACTN|nr:hypothetical protein [Tessaracoccus sp. T21]WGT48341.1 hypothetical protein QH948_06250 [Tessaracoccus sp. T21]
MVGPHFGPLLGEGYATWREAFTRLVTDILDDGSRVGIDLGWDPDEIRAVLAENSDALDEVTVPQLIEVDHWSKNSMIRDGHISRSLTTSGRCSGIPLWRRG